MKAIPGIIRCSGRRLRELKRNIREVFDEKTTERITKEVQKTGLWENETITEMIMVGLIQYKVMYSFSAAKFC